MTAPTTLTFGQMVSNWAAIVQGRATKLVNFLAGSLLRALAEANAAAQLFLQAQNLQVLRQSRLATSVKDEVDSFIADYGLSREPAVAATGQVTVNRFTAAQQAVVPIGGVVQTADGTQQFTVTVDTTNLTYSAALNGYVLAAGVSSLAVPVQAVNAGTQGNVAAGAIALIAQAMPGIDTVTNAAAFTNGIDEESDDAVKVRFPTWIISLSKATEVAIENAIISVQQNLQYQLVANQDYSGATDYGYFYAVVDDGSGSPPSSLLSSVASAIDAVDGWTIRFGVFGPTKLTANVAMTITTATGYVHATVVGQVATALSAYINALPLGTTLPWSRLAAVAYGVAGVTDVTGVTLNGGTADLVATAQQVIKAGTMAVA